MGAIQGVWIRGPELRKRWGNDGRSMPRSTFYDRLDRGKIPDPEFPFGPDVPHWRMSEIEAFEEASRLTQAA